MKFERFQRSLNLMVIYVYMAPGWGQTIAPGVQFFFFRIINLQSISFKFFSSTDVLTIFPIQMHGRPMLTLPYNRSGSSRGHDLYKPCRAALPDASCQVSKS